MATVEVPMADPLGSPKHVSADYYYRIPVRPIYKSYPIYAPGREPAGYIERLQREDPVVLWDDNGHAPRLTTDAEWLKAGAMVFDAPLGYTPLPPAALLKACASRQSGPPVASRRHIAVTIRLSSGKKGRSSSEGTPARCATPA